MIRNQYLSLDQLVDLTDERLEPKFRTRVEDQGRSDAMKAFPSGVAIFVSRKNAPPMNRIYSSSLNGSDLEQIVHNIIGRLSLEWVEIWNKGL